MWTRPDTGDAPVSYPAPTFSAAKGMFESICWLKSATIAIEVPRKTLHALLEAPCDIVGREETASGDGAEPVHALMLRGSLRW